MNVILSLRQATGAAFLSALSGSLRYLACLLSRHEAQSTDCHRICRLV
jgi:hypothetical protein